MRHHLVFRKHWQSSKRRRIGLGRQLNRDHWRREEDESWAMTAHILGVVVEIVSGPRGAKRGIGPNALREPYT
jgi:hypothetical protein